jgi:hypothetical protein
VHFIIHINVVHNVFIYWHACVSDYKRLIAATYIQWPPLVTFSLTINKLKVNKWNQIKRNELKISSKNAKIELNFQQATTFEMRNLIKEKKCKLRFHFKDYFFLLYFINICFIIRYCIKRCVNHAEKRKHNYQ